MKLVGLTGCIATGKSTAASIFRQLGFIVIDADELAHKAYEKGSDAYFKIIKAFGDDILDENGNINRKKLAKKVINNREKLALLESIVHPEIEKIRQHIFKEIEKNNPDAVVIYDVPLLFEKNLQDMFDCIIVVYTSEEIQLKRLMNREKISNQEAITRIKLQIPCSKKVKQANFVIDNSKDLNHLTRQVKEIAKQLLNDNLNRCK